jgi:T4-like virus Myoviridae tail sheath stabiliser
MLSNFQVEFGDNTLQTIPVYYGDPSRQAAIILKQNSENTLNAVPAMSVYINGLIYDRDRLQNPYFDNSVIVRKQQFDPVTQTYNGNQDGVYSVDRLMPAPYKLTCKCDIWTSNTDQKHQIIEQLLPLFNPGLEIQSTDNFLDWTSLSVVLLTDVQYTSRAVPAGGDETIDICSLAFEMPIWLSLPAVVKKGGVVSQIIASLYNSDGDLNPDFITTASGLAVRQRFTPLNYKLYYSGNTLTLYQSNTNEVEDTVSGVKARWQDLVVLYGKLTNGISQIRLYFDSPDGSHEIVGTVAYSPVDPTQLLFTPDTATLPANTLTAVTAIIDPQNVNLTNTNILSPAVGTSFLILNAIGSVNSQSAAAWAGASGTNLVAHANDIITWNGQYWTVSFDSASTTTVQYVTNLNTTVQYSWTGSNWVKSVDGLYNSGEWSLVL